MAWLHTQAGLGKNAAAASVAQAFTPTAAGRLIIVMGVGEQTATDLTISDTQNTIWNEFVAFQAQTSVGSIRCWWGLAKNTNATTITVTELGGSGFAGITIDEFSGHDPIAPFDTSAKLGNASALASPSLVTGANNCLIWEGITNGGTGVAGTTNYLPGGADGVGEAAAYKFLGANTVGQSQSTAWTGTSGGSLVAIASFKQPFNTQAIYPAKISPSLGALNSNQSSSQLVRTSTGNLYTIVVSTGKVQVYKSTNQGINWVLQDYSNSPPGLSTVSAVIDGTDTIHVAYAYTDNLTLKYLKYSTATDTFGSPRNVVVQSGTSPSFGSVAIAVDSNNNPHVAWTFGETGGPSSVFRYGNLIGSSWTNVNFDTNALNANKGFWLDIQIDQNNVPWISYSRAGTVSTFIAGNKNNASLFTIGTAINPNVSTTSLVIDSLGNVWGVYQGTNNGQIQLIKHNQKDPVNTWQTAVSSGFYGKSPSLALVGTDIYVFYERNLGGIAYDRYDSINGKWLGEQVIVPTTSASTTNFRPHNPFIKWSNYFDNGLAGGNNQGGNTIEYLFDDGSTVYYNKLDTVQISTGLASFSFSTPAGGTTTSTSSTSSSTSTSISTSTSSTSSSTSISTSSTSSSTSHSTSSTSSSISTSSTSSSTSISTSSTSSSTSISSTSSSTSQSTSTSSTSSSTSLSTSTSISSTSSSTSISTSSTSSSISTSSTSSSTSASTSISSTSSSVSTSTSISTSSTSSSTSLSTSSTSSSISTSSTSSSTSFSTSSTSSSTSHSTSTSASTSFSTSSTSSSTSLSTSSTSSSISTSSTSSSISTSSTSSSTSLSTSSTSSSVSTSTSISSTSSSTSTTVSGTTTSTSISTSSTSSSTSTSFSTSSTSSSLSTSSTSSSTSHSTSSTSSSTSFSTSSTSSSTSHSTSSTSSSTSLSTSSTSSSTSFSTSTSSTLTSFSTSTTTTPATTTSTSSTSSSTSSTTTLIDINTHPRVTIRPDFRHGRINSEIMRTRIKLRLR